MPTFSYKAKLFACTASYLVADWFKNGAERPGKTRVVLPRSQR